VTIDDLLATLRDSDAGLYLDPTLRLRYVGPKLAPDDPIRGALAEHREGLRRLFSMPSQRCVFTCPNVLADGDKIACPEHRAQMEALPMTSWPEDRARILAARAGRGEPAPAEFEGMPDDDDDPLAGRCTEARPCAEHFDLVFEAHRDNQTDAYMERGIGRGAA
jgi:hypothetical protein